MIRTWITSETLDTSAILESVRSDADGAVLLFAGTVREQNEGQAVTGMRYDAYPEMAERMMHKIAEETATRWDVTNITAAHRTGDLSIGETSVIVAVASPHREEAFEAGRHVIEEIKKRLPVWKQEHYVDGSAWLEGNRPPSEARHE
jgi:molybdopterin synthase catalytic subunit